MIYFNPKFIFSQTGDLGSWNIVNIKYIHSSKTSFFTEGQIRSLGFYDQFHYYEYKGGATFKPNKQISFTLAAGNYQTYKEGGNFKVPKNNNEFRLWPQICLFQQINQIHIEQRYRAELRWTSNGYRNRFRYRVGLSYPIGKKQQGVSPFLFQLSNELFFTNRATYFERNRLQSTLSYKMTPKSSLQMGYIHQFDYKINDETGRDFLVMGFYYELKRKKRAYTAPDIELNDN